MTDFILSKVTMSSLLKKYVDWLCNDDSQCWGDEFIKTAIANEKEKRYNATSNIIENLNMSTISHNFKAVKNVSEDTIKAILKAGLSVNLKTESLYTSSNNDCGFNITTRYSVATAEFIKDGVQYNIPIDVIEKVITSYCKTA